MISLQGAIVSFKIIFSIFLTIVLSTLTKDHQEGTKGEKIFGEN